MDPADPEVLAAKIKYKEALGFHKLQVFNFVLKVKDSDNPDILYLLGQYYESQGEEEEAVTYYRLALEKGNQEASSCLFHLYRAKKRLKVKHLSYLGNYLNKDANFTLGSMFLAQKKEQEAIIRLSLAAIFNHPDAIMMLSDHFYHKKDYHRVIDYVKEYLKLDEKKRRQEMEERLGICYYHNKDYDHAYETLRKCSTGEAYFLIGQMYETGIGKIKNMDRALRIMKKAVSLDIINAKPTISKFLPV